MFELMAKEAKLEAPAKDLSSVDYAKWRSAGIEALIKGGIMLDGTKLTVEFRLYDTVREIQLIGKRYVADASSARAVAHKFSDDLYLKLTGLKGIFSTKILFVSDRTKNKEIYLADYDGFNLKQLTNNKSINLHPQLSHDGERILYTSYQKGYPCVYMQEVSTGKVSVISDRRGINVGGRWSPDDKLIALTVSGKKSPEIAVYNTITRDTKELTDNYSIDVSPSWSPDGKTLVYSSDTGGNPHLYVINSSSGSTSRLTFEGKFHSTPAYSPDGMYITYARMDYGNFNIWIMSVSSGESTQLTFAGNNTEPTWSPDGRYILFSRKTPEGGTSLYMIRKDGTGLKRLEMGEGNEMLPSWAPGF